MLQKKKGVGILWFLELSLWRITETQSLTFFEIVACLFHKPKPI